jgi:AraC-like DNA-binding protein
MLSTQPTSSRNNFVLYATSIVEKKICLEKYSINMFAKDLFMSKSSLNKKVKTTTGLTPNEFIENVKFNYAIRLFKESDLTIKEIAYSSGFNDPKYFARRFKKEYGMTPKEYKNATNKTVGYIWHNFNLN